MNVPKIKIKIEVDDSEVNALIEKTNRLTKLLREAKQIIDSLSGKESSGAIDSNWDQTGP